MRRLTLLDACGSQCAPLLRRAQGADRTEARVQALTEAISYYPTAGFLYRLIGVTQLRAGQAGAAMKSLETAVERDPHPLPIIDLALAHRATGNSAAEEDCYHRVLQMMPKHPGALFGLGRIRYAQRDRAAAVGSLTQALNLDEEATWAAEAHTMLDDLLQVHTVVFPSYLKTPVQWSQWTRDGVTLGYPSGATAEEPRGPRCLHLGGEAFYIELTRRRLDDATEGPWRRMLRRIEQRDGWSVQERQDGQVSGFRARTWRLYQDDTDDVELQLLALRDQEVVQAVVHAAASIWLRAKAEVSTVLSRIELVSTRTLHKQALADAEAHLLSSPQDVPALLARGTALLGLGDYETAEKTFQSVLRQDAEHVEALSGLAKSLWKQKKPEAVIKLLEKSAEAVALSDHALILLAASYQKKGNHAKAEWFLQQALDRTPEPWRVRLHLASTYESMKQPTLVAEQFGIALEQTFDPCAVHLLRAAFLRRQKAYHEATVAARIALDIDPLEVQAHLMLGLAYTDMDCFVQAETALLQAADLDRGNAAVQAALQDLSRRSR